MLYHPDIVNSIRNEMTLQLTLAWWHIPTVFSVLALMWITYWTVQDIRTGGWFTGLVSIYAAVPALIVMLLAWFIGALCK